MQELSNLNFSREKNKQKKLSVFSSAEVTQRAF